MTGRCVVGLTARIEWLYLIMRMGGAGYLIWMGVSLLPSEEGRLKLELLRRHFTSVVYEVVRPRERSETIRVRVPPFHHLFIFASSESAQLVGPHCHVSAELLVPEYFLTVARPRASKSTYPRFEFENQATAAVHSSARDVNYSSGMQTLNPRFRLARSTGQIVA